MHHRIAAAAAALALLTTACSGSAGPGTSEAGTAAGPSYAGTEPAPEFPAGLDWINTEGPLRMADLRGKVVLLDFWTYGCINCMHVIPDLERLEEEYPEELVVVGVHSAKFDNEAVTANIREVVQRYGVSHPVVNDRDFEIWRAWGARAWPTLVVVDPAGNVVGGHAGEGVYEVFQPVIESLVAEFDAVLDRTPVAVSPEANRSADSVLSYPGKVLADAEGGRLFVADTNHHRIVVADLDTGEVLDVAGGGRGYEDGGFGEARFDRPQGMALAADGRTLFVADTGNHSIRRLDLQSRGVSTLAGSGYQATSYPPNPGTIPAVSLASPWDLEPDGSSLYVAMAGSHQIWVIDLESGLAGPLAGSGREGTANGPAAGAELAQPSGLARDGSTLYFADSESSAIRAVDLDGDRVVLVAGSDIDLFTFGDEDGPGPDALLQHPLGVAVDDAGFLYVADTYNSKLKRYDPQTGEIRTFSGGEQGWADGGDPRYSEPGGIDWAAGRLYVADTNNHAVRVVDPATGAAETLVLYGIERFAASYEGVEVTLEPATVAPGPGTLVVEVALPDGYKVNGDAPFAMEWIVGGGVARPGDDARRTVLAPEFPLRASAEFVPGASGSLTADLTIYYCTDEDESLCLIEQVRVTVPVEVAAGGAAEVVFPHTVEAPEF